MLTVRRSVLFVSAVATLAALAGCTGSKALPTEPTPPTTTADAAASPASAPPEASSPAASVPPASVPAASTAAAAADPETAPLTDGQHTAFLSSADVGRGTVDVDLTVLFTGAAAVRAAKEDGLRNTDHRLYMRDNVRRPLTLPVAPDATFTMEGPTGAVTSMSFAQFQQRTAGVLQWVHFTSAAGRVTAMSSIYVPNSN